MKKYQDFILEDLNIEKLNQEYDVVIDKLEEFWASLDEKLERIGNTNTRTDAAVLAYNEQERQKRGAIKKPTTSTKKVVTKPPAKTTPTTTPVNPATTTTKQAPIKNLTPRQANFHKDSYDELISKLSNPDYTKDKNVIKAIRAELATRKKPELVEPTEPGVRQPIDLQVNNQIKKAK